MATIEHLNLSISELDDESLTKLFMDIRANRRRRPSKTVRKAKSNASATRRSKSKKAPSQQDIFAMLSTMNDTDKANLARKILEQGEYR